MFLLPEGHSLWT